MTARPRQQDLERYRDRTVPDLVGDDVRLVIVGINPSLWTAATGAHFAHPSNRFYTALWLAGIAGRRIDPTAGMSGDDREHLVARGLAITNFVARATARASELSSAEIREGLADLEARVRRWGARVVAFAGITAYRTAFRTPTVGRGEQPDTFGGARCWVVPNPSGLNAHETPTSLARAYREPAVAAGMPLDPPRW